MKTRSSTRNVVEMPNDTNAIVSHGTPPEIEENSIDKKNAHRAAQLEHKVDDIVIIDDVIPSTPPPSRSSSNARGRAGSNSSTLSRSASSSRTSSPRPKIYICTFPGCTKAYSRPSLLDQHMRTHYGYKPFKCDVCAESFTRKDHLERHMLKHTADEDKPFHCSICGKGVNSKQHLKRHEKTHFKSFVCSYDGCGEAFYKHQSLKAHIRAVHEGHHGHDCKICGKHFDRPNRLMTHMERNHSDSAKFVCDYPGCHKSFRVWSALQLHMKTEHPRLECKICGRKCVGATGLANHMKIHDESTVIKLWKCKECGEKFHKKEDAVRHYAEKHPLLDLPEELQYDTEREKSLKLGKCLKHKRDELENENIDEASKGNNNENGNGCLDAREPITLQDSSDSLTDYGFIVSSPTNNSFKRHQANRIPSSPSVMDLLVDNVDLRLECPYTNCHRLFRKEYDLHRHLEWHKKQDVELEQKMDSILSEYEYNDNGELMKIKDNTNDKGVDNNGENP